MTFYRITWSEHGGAMVYCCSMSRTSRRACPDVANFCICDNEPLAKYLVDVFFSNFASFKVSPGLKAIQYLPLTEVYREGDTRDSYSEVVKSADHEVRSTWKGLGTPYAVDMPPEMGPTRKHEMYSLFLDASDALVTVNGRPLRGRVVERDFAGARKSTAFLAFSETWMARAIGLCRGARPCGHRIDCGDPYMSERASRSGNPQGVFPLKAWTAPGVQSPCASVATTSPRTAPPRTKPHESVSVRPAASTCAGSGTPSS